MISLINIFDGVISQIKCHVLTPLPYNNVKLYDKYVVYMVFLPLHDVLVFFSKHKDLKEDLKFDKRLA